MSGGFVLGLDSCGAETTLAFGSLDGEGLTVLRESKLAARTAGALLTGALHEILGSLAPAELRAIVVARGPGSFTGMRVGLSAVKGLAEAGGISVVAVSRLAVLAQAAQMDFAALYAGRAQLYVREAANGREQLLTADELLALAGDRLIAVCEERASVLLPESRIALRSLPTPTAADALRFALPRVLAGAWEDLATLDALYLWRADQMLRPPP